MYITKDFDVKNIVPKIKRAVKDTPLLFAYSVEKSYHLHVHIMLILDTKDPDSLFVDQVVPALAALKNTTGCVINLRKTKIATIMI